jgi:hypothetical protein
MMYGQGLEGQAADETDMLAVLSAGCGLVVAVSNSTEMLLPEQPIGPCRSDEQTAALLLRCEERRSFCDDAIYDESDHLPRQARDTPRENSIKSGVVRRLCRSGGGGDCARARQIVLAHSFAFRSQLASYGGEGYTLPLTFLERLRRHGLGQEEIDAMTIANMGRYLAWCAATSLDLMS